MFVFIAFALLGVLLESPVLMATTITIAAATTLITVVLCLRAEQRMKIALRQAEFARQRAEEQEGIARLHASLAPSPGLAAMREASTLPTRFFAAQQ